MDRGAGYVGTQARLSFATIGTARIGATETSRGRSKPTWQVTADSKVSDDLRLQISNLGDLLPNSPRSLSLGITRIDTVAQLTYTPDLAWTFSGLALEEELSDRNHVWRAYVSPRRALIRTPDWNIDLGISGNWYGYSRKTLVDGYYSPSLYEGYATTAYFYYKLSDENALSLTMSYGVNKDETLPRYKFTQDYAAEATFGALSDWTWKIRAAYSTHGANGPNFTAESVGMTLVKRF